MLHGSCVRPTMRSVKRMFSFTDFYLPFGLEFRLNSHFNWPVSDFYVTTIRATAPTTMFSTAAAKTAKYKMPAREKEKTTGNSNNAFSSFRQLQCAA